MQRRVPILCLPRGAEASAAWKSHTQSCDPQCKRACVERAGTLFPAPPLPTFADIALFKERGIPADCWRALEFGAWGTNGRALVAGGAAITGQAPRRASALLPARGRAGARRAAQLAADACSPAPSAARAWSRRRTSARSGYCTRRTYL